MGMVTLLCSAVMSWGTVSSQAMVPRHPESLTARTSAAALAVASEVGARVADPERVAMLVAAASRQTAHPASVHWRDHAVGQGHAGLALLFGALDQQDPGQGWERTAHRHLTLAARALEAVPRPPAGLFAGLAGVGLVATVLSDDGARYRRLLATLDQALAARVPALVGALERGGEAGRQGVRRRVGGCAVRELDLISGLSGIAAYLLLRREEPGVGAALHEVLGSLVELTGSDEEGPRWRTRADQLGPDERARYPTGYLNCGLAHGIPGLLAVLSLALRVGTGLPGLPDAVARTADWLSAHRTDDPPVPTGPTPSPCPTARPTAARSCPRGRPGATADLAWPPPCGSPATPWGTRRHDTTTWRRQRCRPLWPGRPRWRGLTPPPSATGGPGCWPSPRPSPGRLATTGSGGRRRPWPPSWWTGSTRRLRSATGTWSWAVAASTSPDCSPALPGSPSPCWGRPRPPSPPGSGCSCSRSLRPWRSPAPEPRPTSRRPGRCTSLWTTWSSAPPSCRSRPTRRCASGTATTGRSAQRFAARSRWRAHRCWRRWIGPDPATGARPGWRASCCGT